MKWRVALVVLAAAAWAAGCASGCTPSARTVSATAPRPADKADAINLWATPPAAINWDDLPGPDGVQLRVFLFQAEQPQSVLVKGTLEFMMYAGRVQSTNLESAQPLRTWTFTSQELATRQIRDMVGWGYFVRLGWGLKQPTAATITVTAKYVPPAGDPVFAAPISIQMPTIVSVGPIASRIAQATNTQEEGRLVQGTTISRRMVKVRHERVDADPPGARHGLVLLADIRGNHQQNIIVGCGQGEVNLFWYEAATWQRYEIAAAPNLGVGGAVLDVNHDGRPDIIAGQAGGTHELYWFECPADPVSRWTKHLIDDRLLDYHDIAVADLLGDGKPRIVVLSSKGGRLAYYDVPKDPRASPWPKECFHEVAAGLKGAEGLVVADVNGDKKAEIVAGTMIFERAPSQGGGWTGKEFAEGFGPARLAAADIDADGKLEIILCETERNPGRLVWFKGPSWSPHLLREDLFHVRCLQTADFSGDGAQDILVGEMRAPDHRNARLFVYVARGRAQPEEILLSEGISVGEAKAGNLKGDGRPDIASVADDPDGHVDVWFNETPPMAGPALRPGTGAARPAGPAAEPR